MIIKTTKFGDIEAHEKSIIHFPEGILAFENSKRFILIPVNNNPFFKWMQAVDEPDLVFLLVDPFVIKEFYCLELDESLKYYLGIEKQEDTLVLAIVTVPRGGFKQATANLLAPIVINLALMKAKQVVLEGSHDDIKYPLFAQKNNQKASSA
ncbi:MAG: flagellar assembly protein FliW [Bacillota bacterium]